MGSTGEEVKPICVGFQSPFVGATTCVRAGAWGAQQGEPHVACAAVVLPRFLTDGEVFLGGHHVGRGGGFAVANGRPVADLDALLDAPLGRDQNHAVGAARPVNACGCRVFEHLDVLDVVGVQRRQRVAVHRAAVAAREVVLGDGDAVHHVQWIPACRDRAQATDAHNGCAARHARTLGDLDTGCLPLQGGFKRRCLDCRDLFRVDGGDGASDFLLTLHAVAHDHGFVQHHSVLRQADVSGHGLSVFDRHLFGLGEVADVGARQGVISRGQLEFVVADEVREDPGPPRDRHGGRRQGRALFVRDFAFDRALGPRRAEQGERKHHGGDALNWNHGFCLS